MVVEMMTADVSIGLFWFAWTSSPSIQWPAQVLSGIFIGSGIILIFMPSISYLIDVYLASANSAISINTFVRCIVGAALYVYWCLSFVLRVSDTTQSDVRNEDVHNIGRRLECGWLYEPRLIAGPDHLLDPWTKDQELEQICFQPLTKTSIICLADKRHGRHRYNT